MQRLWYAGMHGRLRTDDKDVLQVISVKPDVNGLGGEASVGLRDDSLKIERLRVNIT